MSTIQKTYTYRGGQKAELEKSPDQLVVRTLPDQLDDTQIVASRQVSSVSTRITTSEAALESKMNQS